MKSCTAAEMITEEQHGIQQKTRAETARSESVAGDSPSTSEDESGKPFVIDEQPEDQDMQTICDSKEKYKCQFCERMFSRRSNMKRHLMKHTGERPFGCPHCEKKFSLKSTLNNHMRLHTGEKPYTCETCQKTFRQRANYSIHRKLHTGERNHVCEVCGRQFIQKGHFELHLLGHSGVKAFACQHCDKRFSQNALLKQHSLIHKGDEERKVFVCTVCDKRFCTNRALEFHLKAHAGIKDFQCNYCGKTFQQRNALNRHLKHNEYSNLGKCECRGKLREKEYECHFCLRKFRTKAMLRNHIYSHTGEKPFECKECNKKFTVKSSLKLHMKMYCKGRDICQEGDTKICDRYEASCAVGVKEDVVLRSPDILKQSYSHSDSRISEDEFILSSLVQKSEIQEQNARNTSIPSKTFMSLDSRPILSTITSTLPDKSVPVGGIEEMTQQLRISRDSASVSPSAQSSVVSGREGICKDVEKGEMIKTESANRGCTGETVCSKFTENVAASGCLLGRSSSSEDWSIKDEIEIVDEDMDEFYHFQCG